MENKIFQFLAKFLLYSPPPPDIEKRAAKIVQIITWCRTNDQIDNAKKVVDLFIQRYPTWDMGIMKWWYEKKFEINNPYQKIRRYDL